MQLSRRGIEKTGFAKRETGCDCRTTPGTGTVPAVYALLLTLSPAISTSIDEKSRVWNNSGIEIMKHYLGAPKVEEMLEDNAK